MSALEPRDLRTRIILIPSGFTFVDDKTLLVHQGAVLLRPEGDRGRVIGYTKLCTDVLVVDWKEKPMDSGLIVTCFGCLGATEQ
jgi:hypothetical protein